ncbi:MAG: hypothetical protein KDA84_28470 [Planctomycetaceae bacterium]|nr:hypothetical protein [Planctomycetaceae bacterium]
MPTPLSISSPISVGLFSLLEQAEVWGAEGQFERARILYHQAIEQDTTSFARVRFGEFLCQMGLEQEAIVELSTALEAARRQNDPSQRAMACHHLAAIYHQRGETALAMSYRQQEISARLDSTTDESSMSTPPADFLTLANEALSRGDLDYAMRLAEHARKFAQSQNCVGDLADAWGTWGNIQLLQSNPRAAWEGLRAAYFYHSQARNETGCVVDLLNLSQVARQNGWWSLAKRLLVKAKKGVEKAGLRELEKKTDQFLNEVNRVLAVADRKPEWN